MNKLDILIERSATAYFWVFIVLVSLSILCQFSEEYKRSKEYRIKNGTYNLGVTITELITWTLFVLSCYYK